jgi:hypothetical protein
LRNFRGYLERGRRKPPWKVLEVKRKEERIFVRGEERG